MLMKGTDAVAQPFSTDMPLSFESSPHGVGDRTPHLKKVQDTAWLSKYRVWQTYHGAILPFGDGFEIGEWLLVQGRSFGKAAKSGNRAASSSTQSAPEAKTLQPYSG